MSETATRLFFDKAPGQTRIAVLDDTDRVHGIWFDPLHAPNLVGTVHRVRIARLFLGQNRASATLTDGNEVSIRLRKADLEKVKQGALVVITIVAAPRHGKVWQALIGGRLVGRDMILLAGLSPDVARFQLSSKINKEDRARLLARLVDEADAHLPSGFGIILRRAAASVDDFGKIVGRLLAVWQDGLCARREMAGQLHDAGGLLGRIERLYPEASLLAVEDTEMLAAYRNAVDAAIDTAMAACVRLSCGGHLWCEQTHVLWSVDVDGGGCDDLFRLGMEAVDETARQMRLRSMSGPVMLDLPRLAPKQMRQVLARLSEQLAQDPRHPTLLGQSRSGLVEMTVPHGDATLHSVMRDSPAQEALCLLRDITKSPSSSPLQLAVSQPVATWLRTQGKAALESLDRPVTLVVSSDADSMTLSK